MASKPPVTLIDTTIAPKIRKDTVASPFSGSTLNGDWLGESSEKQQDGGSPQENKNADKKEECPDKYLYPIIPQHCRRWEKPKDTIIKCGTIPAGPLHITKPVRTLPKDWVEHTHLEGKLYYVRDASKSNVNQTALTIVTDSDPRNHLLGLTSVHDQVVAAIEKKDIPLPEKVQLFIQLYPEQDESWGHVGGYYLADLDNQSVFWVEDTESLDLGLGDKINFEDVEERHLKLTLHRQFWYHIEYYPLPDSIDEAEEHDILLKHLTFAMLDVSTSPTSTSTYTTSECSDFIDSIEKTPKNSRTWPIARIAGFLAEHRFLNYYGHPSARLNRQHAFEVEHTEEAAPASDAGGLWFWATTHWYTMVAILLRWCSPASDASAEQTEGAAPASGASAEQTPDQSTRRATVAIFLRLCSVVLFESPIRHHTALEDLFVDKIVYQRNYKRIMKTLLDD